MDFKMKTAGYEYRCFETPIVARNNKYMIVAASFFRGGGSGTRHEGVSYSSSGMCYAIIINNTIYNNNQ